MSDGKYPVRTRFGEMVRRSQISNPGNPGAGSGAGASSTSPVLFAYDRWALSASGAQTKTLTYLPLDGSVHVYLNGIGQDETVDYTLTRQSLAVLTAMGAVSGDVLWARYAYEADSPVFVAESLDGIDDTFDRADGLSVVADRSDGGLWTLPSGDLWAILSNRLVKQVNSSGKISAAHVAYSNSITIEALCKWPDPYARCQAGILGSDAGGAGGAYIEACPFEGYFRVVGPGFGANLLGVTPEDGAEHTLTLTVDLTTGDFVGAFDGVTQQTGTFTSIPTGTIAWLDTYNWVMSDPSTGVLNGFDSVHVTGA